MEEQPVEQLAEYAHEAWSKWMKHVFEECAREDILTYAYIIPPEHRRRWERQMNTPYQDLPEIEKESDLVEAFDILRVIQRAGYKLVKIEK